ncbi:uncharacterized protein LOC124694554 [Lolium rigidum]|uniref:uncharacterized protein LOC124694554 n=1 Tax=Lolium rigidum TaxID=89674 RepID=UPI001F5C973D|nr:uncharacterized protein LOC124694554 [Lolium rigidum]
MAKVARCMALFFLLLGAAAPAVLAVADGLLPNGNFAQAPGKSQMSGAVVTGRYAIPCWEISGFVEYIQPGHKEGDMILAVPEGVSAVRLGNDATIRQTINVIRQMHYSVSFTAARSCAQAEKLNVSVGDEFGVLPIQTVYTSTGWDTYSWAFKSRHATVSLGIHNTGVEEDPACGPLIIAVAIRTLSPPHRPKGNMLRNGDFELGPYIFPGTPWGVLVPPILEDVNSPLSGWMVMSDTKVVKYVDAPHHKVPQGARAVELVAGREAALLQEVPTVPGWSYRLSFSVGDAANGCSGSLAVEAYAARETLKVPYESNGTGGSKPAALEFTAIANATRVVFQSSNHLMKSDATLCGPVLDDVFLVRVRKPAARRLRRL